MSAQRRLEAHLSPERVAELLGVSVRFVRARVARGEFSAARRIGALVRIPESAVAAWVARQPSALSGGAR